MTNSENNVIVTMAEQSQHMIEQLVGVINCGLTNVSIHAAINRDEELRHVGSRVSQIMHGM